MVGRARSGEIHHCPPRGWNGQVPLPPASAPLQTYTRRTAGGKIRSAYRVPGGGRETAGNQTDPCDGQRHSYLVHIDVHVGDMIGLYVVDNWQGLLSSTSGSVNFASMSQPAVGATVTLPLHGTGTVDESATLAP